MAPPMAGVMKRKVRTFVRTRAVTTPTAANAPPPPPRLIDAGLRQSPFPLPMPQLPGTGPGAEKRTTTPPQRPPLDMETTPPRSYAAVLNTNPDSPPHAPPPSKKISPIVVDQLPDRPHHFRKLREVLGHVPNARPVREGDGTLMVRLRPPAERALKLAIKGLPMDTNIAELEEELRSRGYDPQFIRPIQGRAGVGGIFFVEIRRTLGFQSIYATTELLCMPGSRELRNTRAGTAPVQDPTSEPTARSSFMAAANGPNGPKPQRQRRARKRATPAPTATTTAKPIAVVPVPPQPSTTTETAAAAPPKGNKARPQAEAPPAPSNPTAPRHPGGHPHTD
ncbi:proline-rich protein 12-like [Pectinophora gossypiella]|uniref:proline-rich protein 12-like n=1 Tax=Pectinophora gossypiella TaxID=13191 RepID=UPI00214E4A63|nr:proline-rich protein 12-like [Pectinophora gossypiella]